MLSNQSSSGFLRPLPSPNIYEGVPHEEPRRDHWKRQVGNHCKYQGDTLDWLKRQHWEGHTENTEKPDHRAGQESIPE